MTRCRRRVEVGMVAAVMMVVVSSVRGQGRFEVTPFFGYTFSEGMQFEPQDAGGGIMYDELTPKSHLSWGIQGEYVFDASGFGFGFLYSDQPTTLKVGLHGSGAGSFDATNMHVRNYHGYFTLNWRRREQVRPFLLLGLGATSYSFSPIMGNAVDGSSRLSGTLGGGVKYYATEHIGFRGMGRWTPTYISSDVGGMLCSPYWWGPCWVVRDTNYSHQFEMSAGAIFAF